MKTELGFTLVETVIGMLLLAIVVTTVFSVSMATMSMETKSDRKLEAAHILRTTAEKLKVYVTADTTTLPTDVASATGLCPADNTLAPLDAGTHNMNCLLSSSSLPTPRTFSYVVSNITPCQNVTGLTCKQVDFTLNYADTD